MPVHSAHMTSDADLPAYVVVDVINNVDKLADAAAAVAAYRVLPH